MQRDNAATAQSSRVARVQRQIDVSEDPLGYIDKDEGLEEYLQLIALCRAATRPKEEYPLAVTAKQHVLEIVEAYADEEGEKIPYVPINFLDASE